METILGNISFSDLSDNIWQKRDIRVDGYYTMNSPLSVLKLSCFYVFTSLCIGPWMMKDRKAYNIKPFLITFNVIMIATNAYIHIQGWRYAWLKYKWICEPVDTSNTTEAMQAISYIYDYYLTKYLDWMDTLFLVLCKKFSHLTVLHLYHHASMPINIWIIIRFLPGGHITSIVMLNSFVHVVMYTYYALAALGPEWQKYLWWKRYITVIQLSQFIVGTCHLSLIAFCEGDFPHGMFFHCCLQGFIFFFLFINFYIKTYKKKQTIGVSGSKAHAE